MGSHFVLYQVYDSRMLGQTIKYHNIYIATVILLDYVHTYSTEAILFKGADAQLLLEEQRACSASGKY